MNETVIEILGGPEEAQIALSLLEDEGYRLTEIASAPGKFARRNRGTISARKILGLWLVWDRDVRRLGLYRDKKFQYLFIKLQGAING